MALESLFLIEDDPTLYSVEVLYNSETRYVELKREGVPFSPPANLLTVSSIVGALSAYEFCSSEGHRITFLGIQAPPYAREVTEYNSLYCSPLACEITIFDLAITHERVKYASDGKLTVNATTKYPPLRYSLDNVTYSENNTFSLLSPGSYTLYLKDRRGCEQAENFTINEATPPAPHWRHTFYEWYNRPCELTIYTQGYQGELLEVRGTEAVCTIRKGGENDRLKVIKGSECSVSLIAYQNYQFADIFTSDERKHLLELKIDGSVHFKGYLMPEIWTEPYTTPVFPVSFSATDGLSTLKEFEFLHLNGEPITGIRSELEVIVLCLKHLQLDLPITTAIHKYETRMAFGDPDDPLTQAFVDCAAYRGKTCAFVIEEILKPYLGRIYQGDGEWYISQIDLPGRAIARPVLFPSEYREAYFYKEGCEFGLGDPVFYSVPRGAFLSEISVPDANAKRDAVFNLNGQARANELGVCPTEPPPDTGKLYCINASPYQVRIDNNSVFSFIIPPDNVPHLVENDSGPLLFSSCRVRKIDGASFLYAENVRAQLMRAASGGTPNGAIPSADNSGNSPLSAWDDNYESFTLEDPQNPYAPNFNNYQAGQNYVVIFDDMPQIPPLHFTIELYVDGKLADSSNPISKGGSVTCRIIRQEQRNLQAQFKLYLNPIGGMSGLSSDEREVAYGDFPYVETTFSSIFWDQASFNPGFSVVIEELTDDPLIVLDVYSRAVYINI